MTKRDMLAIASSAESSDDDDDDDVYVATDQEVSKFPYVERLHHYMEPWLGFPLESHPALGGPESEFPLPIPEFRKLASEKRAKIRGGKVIN